jgi:hypothetical protein
MSTGIVTIGGLVTLSYTYNPTVDNNNLRTIQGFSTNSADIFLTCQGCPLATHQKYVSYYGDFNYADVFVQGALNQEATNLDNGNADFTNMDFAGRAGQFYALIFL